MKAEMTAKKKIADEFHRVLVLNQQVGNEFVISGKYKDDREWMVLGYFISTLKNNNFPSPEFAIKTNPPDPDFLTFDFNSNKFKPIEVLEILAPGRKRGKEYKTGKFDEEFIKDPWTIFVRNLKKKFKKRYDEDCWLLIYHNIRVSRYAYYGFWHNILLANTKLWYEADNKYSFNLKDSPYEKIFVVKSDGKAAVSIYPELTIIEPETTPNGFTVIR